MMKLALLLLTLAPFTAQATRQFEIFDGQFYNGQHYPLVDIIEWGEQRGEIPHMEFHLHSKNKRMEVTAVPGDKNGRPVLWVMFELPWRNEKVCRHVLAPVHFKKGMKVYAYRDDKDSDYDNIYVSSEPMKGMAEYSMAPYERCQDENASNMPEDTAAQAEAPPKSEMRTPASVPSAAPSSKKEGEGVKIDYENAAVPFSF
jgi:hypothetical protein